MQNEKTVAQVNAENLIALQADRAQIRTDLAGILAVMRKSSAKARYTRSIDGLRKDLLGIERAIDQITHAELLAAIRLTVETHKGLAKGLTVRVYDKHKDGKSALTCEIVRKDSGVTAKASVKDAEIAADAKADADKRNIANGTAKAA